MTNTAVLTLLLTLCCGRCWASDEENSLFKDLLTDYNPLVRPVRNHSHAVVVKMSLVLQQIVEVDEKNEVITINAWSQYQWQDYNLAWDAANYGGIQDVRFPPEKIWKPDILVYNSADPLFDTTYHSMITIYSSGDTLWIPPVMYFPFDEQTCYIKFGSWTYHGFALDLQPTANSTDITEYIVNGEWELIASPVNRSTKKYSCCPEPYPSVKFYFHLRRKTLYYSVNLILPSVLISVMTVLGFTLPSDAGEKITLEITILLSICIFQSYLDGMVPQTSESIPALGLYFSSCMVVVSCSVVMTVVVLNLHYRSPDTHEMNAWMERILLNWLPWMLRMKRPGRKLETPKLIRECCGSVMADSETLMRNIRQMEEAKSNTKSAAFAPMGLHYPATPPSIIITPAINAPLVLNGDSSNRSMAKKSMVFISAGRTTPTIEEEPSFYTNNQRQMRRLSTAVNHHRRESTASDTKISQLVEPMLSDPASLDPGVRAMILLMQKIHAELKFVVRRMEKEDLDSDAISDWKFAAMVVDRVCLLVFGLFILLITSWITFKACF